MASESDFVGLKWEVEDKASGPLGKIEKAYLSLQNMITSISGKLAKSMKSQSDGLGKVGDKAERAEKKTRSLWSFLKDQFKKGVDDTSGSLGEMKGELAGAADEAFGMNNAFSMLTKVMGVAGFLGIIIGVVAFLAKAFTQTLQFRREIAKLNESFSMTKKDAKEVSSAVFALGHSFGKTNEEALAMVRTLLEVGVTPKAAKDAGTSFKELAKITMEVSAATGASSEASAKLTDQLLRINKVDPTNLRGIGFSIKNIADNSRITTDELIAMNEAMEPIFAHLSDQSKDARAAFTQNMLGVAGALSDVGIDGKKATSQFAEMLDETSSEGITALSQLSLFTGKNTDALKQMIKEDPAAIFDEISKRSEFLRKTDPVSFKQMARDLKPLGLGFSELTQLAAKYGDENKQSFKERTAELAALSANDERLAQTAKKRQEALDGIMERFRTQWDNLMLRVGGKLITKIVEPMMRRVIPVFEKFINWLSDLDWDGIFDEAIKIWKVVSAAATGFFKLVAFGLEVIGTVIGGFSAIIAGAFERGWDGAWDATKMMLNELEKLALKWIDSLLGTWDKLVVSIGKYVPGVDISAAEARIASREKEAKKPVAIPPGAGRAATTAPVRTSLERAGVSPVATTARAQEVNMPSRMTTHSPTTEQLLREQNETSRKILEAVRGGVRGAGSAAAAKSNMVLSLAGG